MGTGALFRAVLALLLLGALSGCFSCGGACGCPAHAVELLLETPDGGVAADAFVEGDPDGVVMCTPIDGASRCDLYGIRSLGDGTYSIQVGASGYQTVYVSVTLSIGAGCCARAELSPSVVVLTPSDGGP